MKKSLLLLATAATIGLSAQHSEEFTSSSPCFLGFSTPGNIQGWAGREITNGQWDGSDALTFDVVSDPASTAAAGPYYYPLSSNDLLACSPTVGKHLVDLSTDNKFAIRIKADVPMTLNLLLQEGSDASWNYSNVFATSLNEIDITTTYQNFTLENVLPENGSGDAKDLSKVGIVVFEVAKDANGDYPLISGKLTIDWLKFGSDADLSSTGGVSVNSLKVYPNPATDQLNVVFDATSTSSVQLTDLTGKVVDVQTAKVGANTISFDVANVNAGVYFVNISNAAGNTAQKVIIK